jgi:glutathione S-transferase
MSVLRIFSYLPNPRIAKATIAARLCGVEVDVRGAPVEEMAGWLWDFDAHPMTDEERAAFAHLGQAAKTGFKTTLCKTPRFLETNPYGTVPAAFSPDGRIGIFESNSIARAVVRLGDPASGLYGDDPYTASRIDAFLDTALVFARDTQVYVLSLRGGAMTGEIHGRVSQAFQTWIGGIERALGDRHAIVGERVTLADIVFAAEMTLFHNELAHGAVLAAAGLAPILGPDARSAWPRAFAHFDRLVVDPAFAPDLGPYLEDLRRRG